ncbi:uncharacterized protein EAE97_010319 [Botrytis byssoidea]|uniref:Uncharacterized protein n=1 Tax=Botrytis byssoidea TaxID=139641 RepID=A0A9P5I3L4_9HELO|nr:uncharacterized protein EAE97_010319 [Botrytis byssoidea]KAF7926019.1 hypothetical protein EAE97_010319 [Botrytis byssoidea]
MEISTSLPAVKDVKKLLTFHNLSGEIRNRIYELLLCDFEEAEVLCQFPGFMPNYPVAIARHHIHPQILRTCRQIYQEGTYLMRKKNLFIRFECEVSPYEITFAFLEIDVPLIIPDPSTSRDFKGTVLTHKICYRKPRSRLQPSASFILLARHIPDLCRALSKLRWRINLHDENVKHIVTLTDPYKKQISGLSALFGSVSALFSPPREIESFLSQKQQEELIAPYRAHLKAFPNLEFNGIYKQLRPRKSLLCQKCTAKNSQTSGKRGERLLKGLPVEYLKSLGFIVFEIVCDRAGITSYLMQTKWEGNHEKMFMEAKSIQKAERRYGRWFREHEAELINAYGSDKIAKRYYHLSIAFRQSGHLECASEVIERALGEEPDDSELLIERGNVR